MTKMEYIDQIRLSVIKLLFHEDFKITQANFENKTVDGKLIKSMRLEFEEVE